MAISLTTKILRIIRAAGADVVRRRRIRAQRTRAIDDAGGHVRGFDRLRLRSGFDPAIERGDFVEDVRAGTALAVAHSRHHEQRDRIRSPTVRRRLEIRLYMIRLVSGETSGSAQP